MTPVLLLFSALSIVCNWLRFILQSITGFEMWCHKDIIGTMCIKHALGQHIDCHLSGKNSGGNLEVPQSFKSPWMGDMSWVRADRLEVTDNNHVLSKCWGRARGKLRLWQYLTTTYCSRRSEDPESLPRGGEPHPVGAGQGQDGGPPPPLRAQVRPGVRQDLLRLHEGQVRVLLLQALHLQILPALRLFQLYYQGKKCKYVIRIAIN